MHHSPEDEERRRKPQNSTQNMWLPRLGLLQDLQKTRPQEKRNKLYSISITYLARVLEKFRRILQKHDIRVHPKSPTKLRQSLVGDLGPFLSLIYNSVPQHSKHSHSLTRPDDSPPWPNRQRGMVSTETRRKTMLRWLRWPPGSLAC